MLDLLWDLEVIREDLRHTEMLAAWAAVETQYGILARKLGLHLEVGSDGD